MTTLWHMIPAISGGRRVTVSPLTVAPRAGSAPIAIARAAIEAGTPTPAGNVIASVPVGRPQTSGAANERVTATGFAPARSLDSVAVTASVAVPGCVAPIGIGVGSGGATAAAPPAATPATASPT